MLAVSCGIAPLSTHTKSVFDHTRPGARNFPAHCGAFAAAAPRLVCIPGCRYCKIMAHCTYLAPARVHPG
ncbi:hypothetical protein CBM2623_A240084 [Cupriavidus taiwanensis]|nr:hypothetical protein CBM2608_A240081 [Cupriavidus taiwanensis]SPA27689.1 hypothetical protein CBM2623_A240084 [Cupriavidus taiwanensis]